ncbi:hypothetical protein [Polyangium mundeleinium]|uniref:Uncharacterized protein n=1 Tax=Polyangium mundeleinium TaxID=2995306 RepID=A0ABT5EMZ2_9BACT|nr:hypothetical protein [Polyangium mundeleinium]MDC0743205.1 hypothetical protein [Polyangium mundeleinium]
MPRRPSLEDLGRVLRLAKPNTKSLSWYLEEEGDQLAPVLGVEPEKLRSFIGKLDQHIAPELQAHLHRRVEALRAEHVEKMSRRASSAAGRLASTAVWQGDRIYLDPLLLLGPLLADAGNKFIAFHVVRAFEVRMPRPFLVQVAGVLPRQYDDLVAWLDTHGLHFRWKNGRGGLNFISQTVAPKDIAFGLHVYLMPPVVQQVTRPPPRPRRPAFPLGDEVVSMALFT